MMSHLLGLLPKLHPQREDEWDTVITNAEFWADVKKR